MTLLEDCKQKYAQDNDYGNWAKFLAKADQAEILMAMNIVAQDHAQESVKAKLTEVKELLSDLSCFFQARNEGDATNGFLKKINKTIKNYEK